MKAQLHFLFDISGLLKIPPMHDPLALDYTEHNFICVHEFIFYSVRQCTCNAYNGAISTLLHPFWIICSKQFVEYVGGAFSHYVVITVNGRRPGVTACILSMLQLLLCPVTPIKNVLTLKRVQLASYLVGFLTEQTLHLFCINANPLNHV